MTYRAKNCTAEQPSTPRLPFLLHFTTSCHFLFASPHFTFFVFLLQSTSTYSRSTQSTPYLQHKPYPSLFPLLSAALVRFLPHPLPFNNRHIKINLSKYPLSQPSQANFPSPITPQHFFFLRAKRKKKEKPLAFCSFYIMAKSARASSKKATRARLRNALYAPHEEARLQRLSAKLLALASPPKSAVPTSTMEVDEGTKPSTPRSKGVEQRKIRTKRLRQKTQLNKLAITDATKQTADGNSGQEQVKGLLAPTSSQKPSDVALSHDFKLQIPASFLEESADSNYRRNNRPTFDEEMFYNALGLFPIASIQGFDNFKCLSLAVS